SHSHYRVRFNDPATTAISPLSLHDALPICSWLMKIAVVPEALSAPVILRNACDIRRAWRPTCESPISPSSSALGTSAATESLTMMSIAPERVSMSMVSSACTTVSGCGTGRASDVRFTHLALDLGLGHERGDRVDHDDVDRARADEHVHDLERLLTRVRLRDEQGVGVDAELLGVLGVERVLGVDERGDATVLLRVRDRVQRDRRLARGLGAVHLDDASARQAADAERDVERDRARGDDLDGSTPVVAEAHDRPLAELAVDLSE